MRHTALARVTVSGTHRETRTDLSKGVDKGPRLLDIAAEGDGTKSRHLLSRALCVLFPEFHGLCELRRGLCHIVVARQCVPEDEGGHKHLRIDEVLWIAVHG